MVDMLTQIHESAKKRILFLPHAIRQMNMPDRMISTQEVRNIIFEGEIVEDYPEDARGHSCLILGFGRGNRAIHIVCSPKEEYLAIITAYVPDPAQWTNGWRTRKEK